VREKIDPEGNPPDGVIVFSGAEDGRSMRSTSIWESEEAWNRFLEERLNPAIAEVVGEDAARAASIEVFRLHYLFKP
jgi:heme-degrading monooxygenase HmoA